MCTTLSWIVQGVLELIELKGEFYCGHVRGRLVFFLFSLTDCVSFMRSCWLWPAAHTPDHDSSCTAPHRHTASPASADTKMDKVVTNDSGHLDLLQSGDKDSVRISGFFNWHISQIIKDQWETNEPRDWFQLLRYVKNDFSICDSDSYWSGLSFTDH